MANPGDPGDGGAKGNLGREGGGEEERKQLGPAHLSLCFGELGNKFTPN